MGRRMLGVVVATLMLGSLLSATFANGISSRSSSFGTLTVRITGLQSEARANVLIAGPRFSRVISKPTTLRNLHPGEYTLSPRKVTETNGVETPAPVTKVKVIAKKNTAANANYYFVPNTTQTIATQETISITGPITGPQTLTLSGSPEPVTPGQILASGPTVSRPDGYILKVVSVSTSGATTTVSAVPATLAQAIPDGSLNLDAVLSELNSALPHLASSSAKSMKSSLRSPKTLPTFDMPCSGSGSISVTPSMGFNFTGASAYIDWSLSNTNAGVTLNYAVNASLAISATGTATCSGTFPLAQGVGPTIIVDAGIPVALTPTYSANVSGTADVTGSFNKTLGESLGVSMSAGLPVSFSSSVTPQAQNFAMISDANTTINLSVAASIGIEIDGIAGVSFDAGPGLELDVNPAANPWWVLHGCVAGGFTASFLSVTVINESTALSWCTILAQASGGLSDIAINGWQFAWQSPTEYLLSIECPTPSECIAVGRNNNSGYIVVTKNDWQTWSSTTVTSGGTFVGVSCVNSNQCVVSGSAGKVLITSNGGASWFAVTLPSSQLKPNGFMYVSCVASGTCFVQAGISGYSNTQIYVSTNSGATWSFVSTLGNEQYAVGHGPAIICVSAISCLAVGGVLPTSTGAGNGLVLPAATLITSSGWISSSNGSVPKGWESLGSVACVNSAKCIATGLPPTPGNANELLTTSNFGKTWQAFSFGPSPANMTPTGVSCTTSSTCLAGSFGQYVWKSANGGANWSHQQVSNFTTKENPSIGAVSCADATHCAVVEETASMNYIAFEQ